MRRLHALPIALAGLALAVPPSADAGLESVCSTCNGQPRATATHKHKFKKERHLCAACAAKANGTIPADVPVVASAGCSACAANAGTVVASPALLTSTPGYASVGDGSPSPVVLASPSSAPGYAVVGGTVVSAEPAPVGVMRTNYSTGPQAMPGTLGASATASSPSAPGMGNVPYARPDELPSSIYSPQRQRRSILSHLLLPDFGRRRAEAEAQVRERHAQISYGAQGSPSELPASVVYGGK